MHLYSVEFSVGFLRGLPNETRLAGDVMAGRTKKVSLSAMNESAVGARSSSNLARAVSCLRVIQNPVMWKVSCPNCSASELWRLFAY